MIDFHNHLLPAVDDGASTLLETAAAAHAMFDAGVETIVVTPHLQASLLAREEQSEALLGRFDLAFEEVRALVAEELPGIRLERGVELMLDTPHPDLSDPRVRLAGTRFVLVEFPFFSVPPQVTRALSALVAEGWTPVIAHPERYGNLDHVDEAEEWREVGCYLQLNHGSLLGRFGRRPDELAWALLESGRADFLCSDYHARGRLPIADSREALARAGAEAAWDQLTRVNPERMLQGLAPEPVEPVSRKQPFWRALLRRGR